ncbi:MAG: hypothetical protein ACK4NC_06945 [Candidatus Gracilibacteria bacterium]
MDRQFERYTLKDPSTNPLWPNNPVCADTSVNLASKVTIEQIQSLLTVQSSNLSANALEVSRDMDVTPELKQLFQDQKEGFLTQEDDIFLIDKELRKFDLKLLKRPPRFTIAELFDQMDTLPASVLLEEIVYLAAYNEYISKHAHLCYPVSVKSYIILTYMYSFLTYKADLETVLDCEGNSIYMQELCGHIKQLTVFHKPLTILNLKYLEDISFQLEVDPIYTKSLSHSELREEKFILKKLINLYHIKQRLHTLRY